MVSPPKQAPQRASVDTAIAGRLFLHDLSDNRSVSLKRKSLSLGVYQRKGNDMSNRKFRLIAAIGASTVVAVGAVAVGINEDRSSLGTDASSGMSTGVTVTESVAPTIPPVIRATPGITGAAPLPPEEQGLPG